MIATLSSDSVILVSFLFSLILSISPLSMEQLSFHQLSAPKSEFYEPPSPFDMILSTTYELSSDFIALVQKNSFSGKDSENSYHQLCKFEQVSSCLKISSMTHETLNWKLFPFSLLEDAFCVDVPDCLMKSM